MGRCDGLTVRRPAGSNGYSNSKTFFIIPRSKKRIPNRSKHASVSVLIVSNIGYSSRKVLVGFREAVATVLYPTADIAMNTMAVTEIMMVTALMAR